MDARPDASIKRDEPQRIDLQNVECPESTFITSLSFAPGTSTVAVGPTPGWKESARGATYPLTMGPHHLVPVFCSGSNDGLWRLFNTKTAALSTEFPARHEKIRDEDPQHWHQQGIVDTSSRSPVKIVAFPAFAASVGLEKSDFLAVTADQKVIGRLAHAAVSHTRSKKP